MACDILREFMPILKIISGGQTGADRAALDAAIQLGVSHGGWVPKGRLAEDGRIPSTYSLKEMPTEDYPARTEQNIIDSDGTVIISHGKLTGGSKRTRMLARKHKKPYLHIDIHRVPQFLAATEIHKWSIKNNIEILNVAGSRASKDPKIYEDTKFIIEGVLLLSIMQADPRKHIRDYAEEEYLEKLLVPPKTVGDAVDQLIKGITPKDRKAIVSMGIDELLEFHKSLSGYMKDSFRLTDNDALMASCRDIATELVMDEDDAASVILGALYLELFRLQSLKTAE